MKIKKPKLRKFLYESEIEALIRVAETSFWPVRNKLLIIMTCHHAMRAGETINLKWEHIDFVNNHINVIRQKSGVTCFHPLAQGEKDLLLMLKDQQKFKSPFVFHTRLKYPFTSSGLNWLIKRWGVLAGIPVHTHTHMLRHSSATLLINKGVSLDIIKGWLGHRSIKSTEIYVHMDQKRFNNIFDGSIFA